MFRSQEVDALVRAIDDRSQNVDSLLFEWLTFPISDSNEFLEVADSCAEAGLENQCRLVLSRGVNLYPEHDGLALLALHVEHSVGGLAA